MDQKNTRIIISILCALIILSRVIFPSLNFDETSFYLFMIAVVILLIPDISELIGRVRKVKKGDLEIELDQLEKTASAAADEIPSSMTELDSIEKEGIVEKVLTETARSGKVGLILLAIEIEKKMRTLLSSIGYAEQVRNRNLMVATEVLSSRHALSQAMITSLRNFWKARNEIIHGKGIAEDDIVRAVDSGILILKALEAIPHEINVVYHPGVDLYEDKECTILRRGVKGIILETTSPGGATKSHRIFPTTKDDYVKGVKVSWEWNMKNIWPDTWYKDPDSDEVKYAWSGSAEFIGRNLEDL